jgi:hypothetical protein
MRQQRLRKNKLPRPGLQLRITGAFCAAAVACVVLQAVLLDRSFRALFDRLPEDGGLLRELWPELLRGNVLLTLGVLVPLTLLLGTLATFKVAGPLTGMQRWLDALDRGEDPGPCRIRKGDELQDLCEQLNEARDARDARVLLDAKRRALREGERVG